MLNCEEILTHLNIGAQKKTVFGPESKERGNVKFGCMF